MLVVVLVLSRVLVSANESAGVDAERLPPPVADQYTMLTELAAEYGMSQESIETLWKDLRRPPQQAWAAGRFDFWRKSGIDLVPLLVHLGSESDLPMVSEFPLSKYVVFSWLGHLADEEAVEFLLELVDSAFEEGIRSRHDVHYLMYLFNCLGCSGHAKALEFLFNAQSREFWEGTGPNFELPAIEGAMTSEEHAAMRRRMLRESALQAIAASGTERALKALATGQGISPRFHDDLEYLFAVAARTSVGIPGFPENVGRSVPDDKLEALESVCERYGMELFLLRPDE